MPEVYTSQFCSEGRGIQPPDGHVNGVNGAHVAFIVVVVSPLPASWADTTAAAAAAMERRMIPREGSSFVTDLFTNSPTAQPGAGRGGAN